MLSTPVTIEAATELIHSEVVALREEIFPGANTTGVHFLRLMGSRPDGLKERCEGDLVGYVVTELRDAKPLRIDGLFVSDASFSQGISRALVGAAVQAEPMRQHTHISWFGCRTQRLKELSASVGFAEELVLVPQRLDFAFESGHGVR